MDNFNDLIRKRNQYNSIREDRYKSDSRDRLSKILKKKVETTMIGALSSVEEHLSFLWESDDGDPSPEQKIMSEIYQKVRSEILDKGNDQARNVDAELAQYEVKWLKFKSEIPVIQHNDKEGK